MIELSTNSSLIYEGMFFFIYEGICLTRSGDGDQ